MTTPFYIFDSFDAVSKACLTEGYEYQKLIDVVVRKNKIFQDSSSPTTKFVFGAMRIIMAVGLPLNSDGKISVLDFGGGGGHHRFITKNALGKDILFDWRVIETPLMAKVGDAHLAKNGFAVFPDH